jgi:hypothetical protein
MRIEATVPRPRCPPGVHQAFRVDSQRGSHVARSDSPGSEQSREREGRDLS